MPDRPLLLATTNPAKIERLQWALDGHGFAFHTLRDLPGFRPPDETGHSYEENAVLKAVEASGEFGGLAVASDGGVLIPALGPHWNGLFTARAAGEGATDLDRLRHLLELMAPYRGEQRQARWSEGLALADRGVLLAAWEVQGAPGLLVEEFDPAKMRPGFWIDTIWFYPELGKLHPDLTGEERERVRDTWAVLKQRTQEFLAAHPDVAETPPATTPDPRRRSRWEFSR